MVFWSPKYSEEAAAAAPPRPVSTGRTQRPRSSTNGPQKSSRKPSPKELPASLRNSQNSTTKPMPPLRSGRITKSSTVRPNSNARPRPPQPPPLPTSIEASPFYNPARAASVRSPTARSKQQHQSNKVAKQKKSRTKQKNKQHQSSRTNNHRGSQQSRRPRTASSTAPVVQNRTVGTTLKDLICGCKRLVCAIGAFVLFCIAGGILLWQFLPSRARHAVQAVVDNGAPLVGTGLNEQDGPPLPPAYSFHQCNGDDDDTCCNGIPGLCNVRADAIAYAGVHNAQANLEDGFLVAPNHRFGVLGALEYGYRVVNLDMGVCDGTLVLFHGYCRLGTTDILETFLAINDWLTENPREVVIFPIQIDNSGDGTVNLRHLYSVLEFAGNFTQRMVALPSDPSEPWPTLGELVAADQRVLFFHYNSAGCDTDNCPNTLHNWFMYAAETYYGNVDETDFADPDVCAVNRGLVTAPLFALNAFVEIPSQALSGEVLNRRPFLEEHMATCAAYNGGIDVNVIFVDYWFYSDLPAVVQDHNRRLAQQQGNLQQRRNRSFLRRMVGY